LSVLTVNSSPSGQFVETFQSQIRPSA